MPNVFTLHRCFDPLKTKVTNERAQQSQKLY